ncbi:hypothetical protein A6P39_015430 [Streptomyces sp. FXJ1.172]|uniref:hypothetical protein n=1 Tax=Streptomyces sp. FXJ1.172 TaxID=710705 RepID=UPI0007D03100|nr:hypothetical protein [Streptomyces sp. FXJ1.172]WEO95304.1 hypothetical protein A6P39_015430 [Streptomyces sp. FXJ1.172]
MTFEIRVICASGDADRVSGALAAAFQTGAVRRYPTRDGRRTRLYVTAGHRDSSTNPIHTESE